MSPTLEPDDLTSSCGKCGAPITAFSPGGVCTVCLVTSVLGEDDGEPAEAAETSARLASAPEIDGYDFTEKLGEGGFGEVFAATQTHPVQRQVAVKVLKPGVGGDQALARFEAERQALAMMDHPNIAVVYDAGETADGRPYFVMERICGRPLVEFCKDENLEVPDRLRLFQEVCTAIGHAHRRGIIHRDIKPSNVLVSEENAAAPKPKVIDFGIAKATEFLLTDRTLFTQHNQLIGTPAYMSPEQAESRADIDVRSDIYSLGILLYELTAGSPPFRDTELHSLPYDEALRKIRTETPPLPSFRVRETGAWKISSDLDWIVMKAIEKDPALRYETAEALARDLGSFLRGSVVDARPPSVSYRLRKFVRRNRLTVGAAGAVALALVAGTIVSLVMYLRAEKSAEQAVASDLQGRRQFSLAEFKTAGNVVETSPAVAVAHLARALETDPDNEAAAIRLRHLLASQDWPTRVFEPLDYGSVVRELAYSIDGEHIFVTGNGDKLNIHDSRSGENVHSIPLGNECFALAVSPDGIHLAALVSWVGVEVINVLTGEKVATVKGRPRGGGNVTFSPDGSLLGCAFNGGDAMVWNVANREVEETIECGDAYARIGFAPDGNRTAVASNSGIQILERGVTSKLELPFVAEVRDLVFSRNGEQLVLHCSDDTMRVVDLDSREVVAKMPHGVAIESFALSPDGSLLATGSYGGLAQVWELETGNPVGVPVHHDDDIVRVSFSPDGRWVLSAGNGNNADRATVRIWDARSGESIISPIYHPRGASSFAFSPDGQNIVLGSRSKLVAGWRILARSMRPLRLSHGAPVWKVGFDPSKSRILTLTPGGRARAWNAESGEALATESETIGEIAVAAHANCGHSLRHGFSHRRIYHFPLKALQSDEKLVAARFREGGVRAAAASEDGEQLVTGGGDGAVRVWSLRDGSLLHTLSKSEAPVSAVAIDMTGTKVAAGFDDGFVRVWAGGDLIFESNLHDDKVIAVSISDGGAFLASGAKDRTARIVMLESGVTSPPLEHDAAVAQLSFSPDQSLLATSGPANAARIWSAPDGKSMTAPLAHLDRTSASGLFLLWTPDGKRLVTTGSNDNTARLWDITSGSQLAEPMSQPAGAFCASLDPDGKFLLFGSDGMWNTRLWDMDSGQPLTPLAKYDGRAMSCVFSPDGLRYAVGTMTGTVFVHPFPPSSTHQGELLRLASQLGGFRFSDSGILEQTEVNSIELTGSNDSWVSWLAADPASRAIAPGSGVTHDAYIEDLLSRGRTGDLRDALRWRPDDPEILFRYGDRLAKTGRDPEFGSFLVDRALELSPMDQALRLRGIEHWLAFGAEGKAYLELAQLLATEPDDSAPAWLALGRGLASIGSIFDAKIALTQAGATEELTDLERGLQAHHRRRWELVKNDASELAAVLTELASDDPFHAVRSAATALAAEPDDAMHWTRLAEVTVAVSQITKDESLLGFAIPCLISGAPSQERVGKLTARIPGKEKIFAEETLSDLARRLELGAAEEAWLRGCAAYQNEDFQQSMEHFTRASLLLPDRPLVENRLGVAHYRLDQLDDAADAFARALAAASEETPELALALRQNLHFVLRKLGRNKEAHPHWLALNQIPDRPGKLSPMSIDLTAHYNAALDRDWFDPRYTNSLIELKPGVHRFGGVEFDVRGLIQLASKVVDAKRFPKSVSIKIEKECAAVHFLYGSIHASDPEGTVIGEYRIVYEDGSSQEVPLEMGKNIRDWWAPSGAKESLDLPAASCVWTGTNSTIKPRNLQLCVLSSTWKNDLEKTVDRLEFSSRMEKGAPFLIALSLGGHHGEGDEEQQQWGDGLGGGE